MHVFPPRRLAIAWVSLPDSLEQPSKPIKLPPPPPPKEEEEAAAAEEEEAEEERRVESAIFGVA